jgi:hypothetical protein
MLSIWATGQLTISKSSKTIEETRGPYIYGNSMASREIEHAKDQSEL